MSVCELSACFGSCFEFSDQGKGEDWEKDGWDHLKVKLEELEKPMLYPRNSVRKLDCFFEPNSIFSDFDISEIKVRSEVLREVSASETFGSLLLFIQLNLTVLAESMIVPQREV